jgi:hypothetical protein
MGPYRTPSPPPPPEVDRGDDRMIYGVLLAIGLIRVVLAIVEGEAFHAEATLAGLLAAAGLIGLLR